MSKSDDVAEFIELASTGHPGITSINQAGLPESFERCMRDGRKINGGLTHQVIIGKSRDGMSRFNKSILCNSGSSSASGLLSGLLRRI
ncbi:hypothetical protein [Janthinobacterium sp. FW305-128]|uniref:hypothetical protein n=1 Tax=Janthinobacterium sp. FW305-128 TaxID=2775055 RepID=UPI001E4B3789|nr:hypothetical protein [Janthinobacterium sp. FW305-128]MCC7684786.1 hypothetical protein [Janthinobacterium sp. FW305-128]